MTQDGSAPLELGPAATAAAPASQTAQGLASRHVLVLLALLIFTVIGLRLIATTPFPAPDELQHVSYAAALQASNRLLPRFEMQKTLQADDFTQWTERPNYIGHPSPFYLLESLCLDRHVPPAQAVIPLRLVSLALVCLGLCCVFRLGVDHFGQDRWALALFCAACAMCPRLLATASQANNDSLAVLGGALALWGIGVTRSRNGDFATGGGLLLALWAKPNAGLEIILLVALTAILQKPLPWRSVPAWIAGGLVGILPYLVMVARYGTIVPITAESLGSVPHVYGLDRYGPAFLLHLGQTWGHLRPIQYPVDSLADWGTIAAFWTMVGGLVLAGSRAIRQRHTPHAAVAAAAPLVLLVTMSIHFWFSATHLDYSLPAAAFRYYLALWPALAYSLGYAICVATSRTMRIGMSGIILAALAAGWTC